MNGTTLILYVPDKMQPPAFAIDLLRPFSFNEPVTLDDFSARRPADTPTASTFEGVVGSRCYRHTAFARVSDYGSSSPFMAASQIKAWWAPQVDLEQATAGPFWRSLARSHMRVLVEARPGDD
eukprot:2352517-Prymnesium_polylepis.1